MSYDTLTTEEATCLKDGGTRLIVQAGWTGREQPGPRVENLRTAVNAGLEIALYISVNGAGNGADHVTKGLASIPNDLRDVLKFVAVDVELPGIPATQIWQAIRELQRQSFHVLIYTSYNAWTTMVVPRNPTGFAKAGIPLWNAYWDGVGDIDFPSLRFGGWADDQVALEQWSGGTNVCGQFVDRNTIGNSDELYGIVPVPPPNEPELPEEVGNPLAAVLQLPVSLEGYSSMTLSEALRRGVVAYDAVQVLTEGVRGLEAYAARHTLTHNETGGARDTHSPEFLKKIADLLGGLENTFREEVINSEQTN